MKRLIAIILTTVFLLTFTACGKEGDKKTSSSVATKDSASQNVLDHDEEVFIIKTDYCDMKYPSKWKNKVKTNVSSEKVSFTTADGKVKLFDLCFGGNKGYVYGVLNDAKSTELRVVSYDIDEKLKNFDECCAMQDDMNIILLYLTEEKTLTEK